MIHYITTNGVGNPWVAAEIGVITTKGIPVVLHSMRPAGRSFSTADCVTELDRQTRIIYPLPVFGSLVSFILAPFIFRWRFLGALFNALFSVRETPRCRVAGLAHLFVACDWARKLRQERPSLIHAQWIHSSGTIGMYGAWLLGVQFSFTGHAVDLFRDAVALRDKIRRADFIICISEYHRAFYKDHGARDEQLHIVYCGIDPIQFQPLPNPAEEPIPRILTLGRLVEKKGFHVLIEACALLQQRDLSFDCEIAGDGPLEAALKRLAVDLDVADRVSITGARILQEDIPGWLAGGSVYVQPCVWSRDGDVDGTPRTLMEAMACGKPSISTRLAGIPDIIEDGASGLLVEPGDAPQLADAIERVIGDNALAERLSMRGRLRIRQKFDLRDCLTPLQSLFQQRLESSRSCPQARGDAVAPILDG